MEDSGDRQTIPGPQCADPQAVQPIRSASGAVEQCVHCGGDLETGPWGFTDCPACNPNPARE